MNYYHEDESVWNDFMSAFDCLPLCAIVNDTIFAVHAGLSPSLCHVSDVDVLDRFQEIPMISVALFRADIALYIDLCYFLYTTKVYSAT